MSISENTNICALATPQGAGAIGIIRLSGPEVIEIVNKVFVPASTPNGKKKPLSLTKTPAYKMRFGSIYNGNQLLDEVLVAVFRAPHSYTGENSVEIYCHGSSYIIQQIMMLLMSNGVKMAEPGEFSKRAFLNGKLDLAQAEAVADLIASETSSAHQIALQQMKGGFSNELKQMRESLLNLASLMELELDFSEEDVEFADRTQLKNLLNEVSFKITRLIESFTLGNVIKNGVPVAIIGATNTGKSTLLNTLLGEEKAIVSNIHGTTRDVIEDTVNLGGITFRFIDTAGIRETKETIEIIGIERTYMKLKQASVVIMVLDATRPEYFKSSLRNLSARLNKERQKVIILINKMDKVDPHLAASAQDKKKSEKENLEKENNAATEAKVINGQIDQIRQICALSSTPPVVATPATETKENRERVRFFAGENGAAAAVNNPLLSPLAILPVSAKQKLGIDQLKELLINTQNNISIDGNATLVSNVRHYQALLNAQLALDRVEDGLADKIPTDLIAQDIREALYYLGSIVGEINTEEILGNIFSRFCIGK